MQIILESTTVPVEAVRDSLSQIKTIALVHDLLAHNQPIGTVDIARVLTEWVAMLTVTMDTPQNPLPTRLDTVSLWIPIRLAIALARGDKRTGH